MRLFARLAALALTIASALALPAIAQTPEPAAAALPAGDADAGAELFGMSCRGCHAVAIAPNLRGISSRNIASLATFDGYSDALKAHKDQTWTDANLDTFLKSPAAFAPGTRMISATPDAQNRADLIAYLKSLPPPR